MKEIVKFLIIDDDADDQDILRNVLLDVDAEIECLTAKNGQEALTLLDKAGDNLPDYIFLDLNMPKMTGKQFLKVLKSNERYCNITIVIYTTSSRETDKSETLMMGAAYFLTKPDSISVLKHEIEHILTEGVVHRSSVRRRRQ